MKAVRLKLRDKLRTALPNLARIDRFNNQYNRLDEEDPIDWEKGAVFIEIDKEGWEQLGAQQIQETDALIRVHVCRMFLGDTFDDSNSDLAILDLPGAVYLALQGKVLVDDQGRTIANALVRTDDQEDNDHDGLEIDIITFRTRITDYLADTSVNWTTKQATLEMEPSKGPLQ